MSLEKARLQATDQGVDDIEFMFNPNELTISRSVNIEQPAGARTQSGNNKTSFKHPNPYVLKISNIILDTYETGENVFTSYVSKFTKAVEFKQRGGSDNKERPPIYVFTWGSNKYIRCFVKDFNCKLSLFLPNGTPVRATIDLSLEQVDPPTPGGDQRAGDPAPSQRESGDFFLGN